MIVTFDFVFSDRWQERFMKQWNMLNYIAERKQRVKDKTYIAKCLIFLLIMCLFTTQNQKSIV